MFDLAKNKIQTKQAWLKALEKIKIELKNKPEIKDERRAVKLVKESLLSAVAERWPKEKFAILFSGGIDSTLLAWLAKQQKLKFNCYFSYLDYIGFGQPADLPRVKSAAKKLGIKLKIQKTKLDELERMLPQIIRVIKNCHPVHVGVAATLWPALQQIKKDKIKIFMSGLGADQIYACGDKYKNVKNINQLAWQLLGESSWNGKISRDRALAQHFKLTMLTPYFSKPTIVAAAQISGQLKIKNEQQKYILRRAAKELGLPDELIWRRPRPAQYGSKFDKALKRLAHQNGFKLRREYFETLMKNKKYY